MYACPKVLHYWMHLTRQRLYSACSAVNHSSVEAPIYATDEVECVSSQVIPMSEPWQQPRATMEGQEDLTIGPIRRLMPSSA
jgi:hypothetical protein